MLDPETIVDAFVTTLQTIPALVAAMNADLTRIQAFHFDFGSTVPLEKAILEMPTPGILIWFDGTKGGNFNGATIWKHYIRGAIRMGNAATQSGPPVRYSQLWHMIVNSPVNSGTNNIRFISILPELQIMDTPSCSHRADLEGIDYFDALFVIPELRDT